MYDEHGELTVIPYCYQVHFVDGGSEEYLAALDRLESLLNAMEAKEGATICSKRFEESLPDPATDVDRYAHTDFLVVMAVNGQAGNAAAARDTINVLRRAVGLQIPEPVAERIKASMSTPAKAPHAAVLSAMMYPLDKVNSCVWTLPEGDYKKLKLKAEEAGAKKPVTIYYSIDYDGLAETGFNLAKRLTQYDKLLYTALGSMYAAGNEILTLNQIYRNMGNDGRMGGNDKLKMLESITKMATAKIQIDNAEEIAAKYNYEAVKYTGVLLPAEMIEATTRGGDVDAAVHLFREPPLMSFARSRKQITAVPMAALCGGISKTQDNLAIRDYLISRIGHMKNGKSPRKILLQTILKSTGIEGKKNIQRVPEKVEKILAHFRSVGYIAGYEMQSDSVSIVLNPSENCP